jgi:hypothetical protein
VDKDISTQGGSGVDVMKNIPLVNVNVDGSVSVRNAAPMIFIDGRPTNLSLEQIPADQIDRVEVITNSSAKFDASSTGGIINIILKKNTKPGYNGQISVGAGTNSRYNLNGNINIKENPFSLLLSANINNANNDNEGATNRNFFQTTPFAKFTQEGLSKNTRAFNFVRAGLDYNLNVRTTISLNISYNFGRFYNNESQDFKFVEASDVTRMYGDQKNEQRNRFYSWNNQLQLKHNFPKKGHEITADITQNMSQRYNNAQFTFHNYLKTNSGNDIRLPETFQLNQGSGKITGYSFQADYILPINDSLKFETGTKIPININHSELNVWNYNPLSGNYSIDSALSNTFFIDDRIYAAYVNISSVFKSITYSAGIRYEQTDFRGSIPDKNQQFQYLYPSGGKNIEKALFPSLYLSKKIGKGNEIQINFSRKINRPGFMQIMPFIMMADRQNIRIGNPALAPEFINIAEINFNKIQNKINWLTALYVRNTQDVITNILTPSATNPDVLISTFGNGNYSNNFGWENSLKWIITQNIDFTFNHNINYIEIQALIGAQSITNSGITWNTKGIVNVKLPKQFNFQLNAVYEAPKIVPQGKTIEVFYFDVSMNKQINSKMSLSLVVSDVLNSKRFGGIYTFNTFEQDFYRRWESRFVRFNFTYRFGDADFSLFKRRGQQRREPGAGGNDMQEM